jgi:hypothetical protein
MLLAFSCNTLQLPQTVMSPPTFRQLHQQPYLPIIRYRTLASHARATVHRIAKIQIRGFCNTPQRNSLYRKQQIATPKARLTTLIERQSVLSNCYDLSRGFTAALAVTLYPGAVSQSVLSSTTHPDVPISRSGPCSQPQPSLHASSSPTVYSFSAAFPDRTLHTFFIPLIILAYTRRTNSCVMSSTKFFLP